MCTIGTYKTFYSGPNRPDPGLVPDGAACGTEKVTILYNSVTKNPVSLSLSTPTSLAIFS